MALGPKRPYTGQHVNIEWLEFYPLLMICRCRYLCHVFSVETNSMDPLRCLILENPMVLLLMQDKHHLRSDL